MNQSDNDVPDPESQSLSPGDQGTENPSNGATDPPSESVYVAKLVDGADSAERDLLNEADPIDPTLELDLDLEDDPDPMSVPETTKSLDLEDGLEIGADEDREGALGVEEVVDSDSVVLARLVTADPETTETVRQGSPFKIDPPAVLTEQFASGEGAYVDLGPYRYTAMGAACSSLLITLFAGLGAFWFPAGGVLVAVLGSLLSIIGMYAPNRLRMISIGALLVHASLFFLSYQRALGS
ncbi:MAG: hypothetical protein AAFX06_17275 [Planctomycetota bacterium]